MRRLLPLAVLFLIAGCSSWRLETRDHTDLRGAGKGDLGLRLVVSVEGAPDDVARALSEAIRAELEATDLFEDVDDAPAAPVASGTASRLELRVVATSARVIHDLISLTDGYVARYDLDARLLDRGGAAILEGRVSGVAWDELSDPDQLSPEKRRDISSAGQRDAALKIGRALRAAADERARGAFEKLERIHLPPGVGPVPIAVLGFDDDPASRRRRGPALGRALEPALARLGPELAVVSFEDVEAEVGETQEGKRSFLALREEDLDRLVPRLGARLFVVGKIEGGAGRVAVSARVLDARLKILGEARAEGEGPGALKLVAIDLARDLGKELVAHPPEEKARREDE